MSNKNNSTEQKLAWNHNKVTPSCFERHIPANLYIPKPKPPSRRDQHRADVAARKI